MFFTFALGERIYAPSGKAQPLGSVSSITSVQLHSCPLKSFASRQTGKQGDRLSRRLTSQTNTSWEVTKINLAFIMPSFCRLMNEGLEFYINIYYNFDPFAVTLWETFWHICVCNLTFILTWIGVTQHIDHDAEKDWVWETKEGHVIVHFRFHPLKSY